MSGHSKWSQIKRKKGANDIKRSGVISKHIRAIQVAVRSGGSGDPAANLALKNTLAAAKVDSVPADNIEAAIKRALGEGENSSQFKEVVYEGYGPGGVAILIEAITDNPNRTVSDIRAVFHRRGGSLGSSGSVAWQFESRGVIHTPERGEAVEDAAIELGAIDLAEHEDGTEVYTEPKELFYVSEGMSARHLEVASARLAMIPQNLAEISPEEAHRVLALLDALDDLDDVQNVYTNANLDAVLALDS